MLKTCFYCLNPCYKKKKIINDPVIPVVTALKLLCCVCMRAHARLRVCECIVTYGLKIRPGGNHTSVSHKSFNLAVNFNTCIVITFFFNLYHNNNTCWHIFLLTTSCLNSVNNFLFIKQTYSIHVRALSMWSDEWFFSFA